MSVRIGRSGGIGADGHTSLRDHQSDLHLAQALRRGAERGGAAACAARRAAAANLKRSTFRVVQGQIALWPSLPLN
jgi:hypothetical protein